MAGFLEQLAVAILKEHGTGLREVAVVLPSQRAGVRLRAILAQQAGSALWSPQVFTLATFMEQCSGMRAMPTEELLFEAYEAYRSVTPNSSHSLEDFLQWAPATLRDISEADAHLVPVDKFYRDLRAWEDLDWSFNVDGWSAGQQRMNTYWTMTGKLHAALTMRAMERRAGTQGFVERTAADKPPGSQPWTHVWFAGLNAFTTAQRAVIDQFHRSGSARFAWDADAFYLNDLDQGAGLHVRAAIRRYGEGVVPPTTTLAERRLNVTMVSTASCIEQAWAAASAVRATPEQERDGTAVVLADASLLEPLLEALTNEDGPVNVTMGRSVASLSAGSLFNAFFAMIAGTRGTSGYLRTEVERVLLHPFLRHPVVEDRIKALSASGRTRITQRDVQALVAGLGDHPSACFNSDKDVQQRTLALISWAHERTSADRAGTEQLYQASIAVQRVLRSLERYGHQATPEVFAIIMERALRQAQIGYFGEPMKGVQVMGMLETRALDFRRVIVVGCQEGKLPANTLDGSYIPFELRSEYKLPMRDDTDAVQSYNFMRLLQHSEEVMLLHPSGEAADPPSRYLAQLRHELLPKQDAFSVKLPLPVRIVAPLSVNRDQAWLQRLGALLEKGISPSALGTWLKCPLDFHFKYILGMKEPEVAGARIASKDLGEALHSTLEDILRARLGKPLAADDLLAAAEQVPSLLAQHLAQQYTEADLREGQPLLQFGMAVRSAAKFLRNEADRVRSGSRIVPLALEEALATELNANIPGLSSTVRLRGRADRIDDRDGLIHILDLKTGYVDEKELDLKELGPGSMKASKGFALQLMLYGWMYMNAHPEVEALRVGLLPLQRPSESEGVYLRIQGSDFMRRGMMPLIAETIAGVITAMADTTRPIQHDPQSIYCRFCAK